MLIVVEREGEPVCIAPLFVEHGMVFNICPEDQLDFVGHVTGPEIIEAVLRAVLRKCARFSRYEALLYSGHVTHKRYTWKRRPSDSACLAFARIAWRPRGLIIASTA